MKKFVNIFSAIAICAAALLSSCIKEQPYELKIAQLEVAVTRADASSSKEQGDGIGNAMFWVFKCEDLDANGKPTEVLDEAAASWRVMHSVNTSTSMTAHMELPLCDTDHQDYILVAVLNTEAFGSTITLDRNTRFAQLQQALFDASGADFWSKYPVDVADNRDPWKMPVSNWKTFTVSNSNTHPSKCYELELPVFRAVAKSQLYVKRKSDNFTVTVTDARICSSAMPSKGAILTSNVKSGLTNNTINSAAVYSQQGNADENVSTPAIYPAEGIPHGTAGEKPLHNAYGESGALAFNATTVSATDYTWVGSTFIYENETALTADTDKYATAPTGNAGYYMQISYQVSGDTQTYTRYVKLPAVVRNHDYQVKATVDACGQMALTISVNEWNEDTAQSIDYQNSVTVETGDMIKWTYITKENTNIYKPTKDDEINENIIVNGKVETGKLYFEALNNGAAECTFKLRTPVGGSWYAELVTISGDPDHFVFEKAEITHIGDDNAEQKEEIAGNDSTIISGDISDGTIKLYIKTAKDNPAANMEDSVVELQITAKKRWGGRERTYKVYGLTGLENNANYTLTHLLGTH